MRYTYELFDSIASVNLDDWSAVCAGVGSSAFMDPRFIRTVETTMADVASFWHVIFYDQQGVPVACASLTVFRVDLAIIAGGRTKQIVQRFRRLVPSLMHVNMLFCGLPVSVGQNSLAVTSAADAGEVVRMLDTLMLTLSADRKIHLLLFKEFRADQCAYLDTLLALGYHRGESPVMQHFYPRFPDFDEYLGALKSHYRYDVTRSRRKLDRAGYEVSWLTNPESIVRLYTREVHRLYEAVVERAENKLEILPPEFFLELSRQFQDQVRLTVISKDNRVAAFNWALATPSTYHFLFCGIDYALNEDADLYFNVMYADLDQALRANVGDIQVGQTSDMFKARLGCTQQPLFVYAKGTGTVVSHLIQAGFRVLLPPRPQVPTYSIFKTQVERSVRERAGAKRC
jgi:hypothetical protein